MSTSRLRLPLQWELGRHATDAGEPDRWIPATVPGGVQLDWAQAQEWPDFRHGRNVEQWAGLEDFFWTYRTTVATVPPLPPGGRLFLVLEGVDYAADVLIGGRWVGAVAGLQTPFEADVTDTLSPGSEIRVRVHPAPKAHATPRDRTQASHSCKPPVSYEWDFHPRLIPLGLWRPAGLEVRAGVHFAEPPEVIYQLSDDLTRATGHLRVRVQGTASGGERLRWTCVAPDGAIVAAVTVALNSNAAESMLPFHLDDVALWWPHDQGTPALYRNVTELLDTQGQVMEQAESRTGFRRVRLVMAPDQWKHPEAFPKSRSLPPITWEVNGRRLFVKGTNWVCPDVFPGTVMRERYAEQLTLVRSANLALVRMWGGAVAPQNEFYELCDELGLLVWQEFPLACNRYPDDADYLAALDRESRRLILRLRPHASVALWCGGNELFNFWSGMTDQSLPLRLLNRNCYDLDPDRPFIPTAPLEGMGHGHYVFRDPLTGQECWAIFQRANCTAYTEFGVPAPPSAASLRRMLPVAEQWPPRPGTSWQVHHAFGAWLPSSHLYLEEIEYYFGTSDSLEQLVERAQLLQAMGLQGIFEEARRQKPVASLALNWCFNEPWPCAANNSLVSWPCEAKPALQSVAAACRPVLASARIPRASWQAGEVLELEFWLLNDGPEVVSPVTIVAELETDGDRVEIGRWSVPLTAANTNARGPRIASALPANLSDRFTLRLDVVDRPAWSSAYTLLRARPGRQEAVRPVEVPAGATNF